MKQISFFHWQNSQPSGGEREKSRFLVSFEWNQFCQIAERGKKDGEGEEQIKKAEKLHKISGFIQLLWVTLACLPAYSISLLAGNSGSLKLQFWTPLLFSVFFPLFLLDVCQSLDLVPLPHKKKKRREKVEMARKTKIVLVIIFYV